MVEGSRGQEVQGSREQEVEGRRVQVVEGRRVQVVEGRRVQGRGREVRWVVQGRSRHGPLAGTLTAVH